MCPLIWGGVATNVPTNVPTNLGDVPTNLCPENCVLLRFFDKTSGQISGHISGHTPQISGHIIWHISGHISGHIRGISGHTSLGSKTIG